MTPQKYCLEKTGGSGSSLYYSLLFLPSLKRESITALHAFYREIAEVKDNCRDPGVGQAKLEWWRREIEHMFSGVASHPVTRGLAPVLSEHGLIQDDFQSIIDAIQADLMTTRYRTFEALIEYCNQTGALIGCMTATILGFSDPETRDCARDLGLARQLCDIVCNVGNDARHNRIYLPLEDLQHFHLGGEDILHGYEGESFRALMAFETERVLALYRQALDRLPPADRAKQLPGLILAAIQRTTLEVLREDGYRVLKRRVDLTPLRKLWIAWNIRRRERHRAER